MDQIRTLIIMRHAQAKNSGTMGGDRERPLSPHGKIQASEVGKILNENKLKPDLILVSPTRRTKQTAHLATLTFGDMQQQTCVENIIYLDGPCEILKLVRSQNSIFNTILLCGHCPSMPAIAAELIGKTIPDFPPATTIVLQFKNCNWQEISAKNCRIILIKNTGKYWE